MTAFWTPWGSLPVAVEAAGSPERLYRGGSRLSGPCAEGTAHILDDHEDRVRQVIKEIPIEHARRILDYDPTNGVITWKDRGGVPGFPRSLYGTQAGRLNKFGYRLIKISESMFTAHRLAWALHWGEQPPGFVDHIDRNRDNNAIENLRIATRGENGSNKSLARNNTSGHKGVVFHTRFKRWTARFAGKHIGYFSSKEEAAAAYITFAQSLVGNFATTGEP